MPPIFKVLIQGQETQWYQDRQTVGLYFTLLFPPKLLLFYRTISLLENWAASFDWSHDATSVPLTAPMELARGELEKATTKTILYMIVVFILEYGICPYTYVYIHSVLSDCSLYALGG